jgi:putative transposase
MAVHPSGYYAWLENPDSARSIEDKRLLGYIKLSWLESNSVYGYRKVTDDLRGLGGKCGKHRVYRLMRQERLRSQTVYRRRNSHRGGPAAVTAPNHLQRQFTAAEPNRVCETDITYIRT